MRGTVRLKGKGKGQLEAMNDDNHGALVSALCMLWLWLRARLKHKPSISVHLYFCSFTQCP